MTLSRVDGGSRPGGRRRGGATALQSLLVDEGAGTLLASAAGDIAARGRGYSARTQAATVVAYHLLGHSGVDRPALAEELVVLDDEAEPLYVDPSDEFLSWLRATREGRPAATAVPSAEPATRVVPVGIWFRRDPEAMIGAAIDVARIENLDAATVVTATAVAGAVAASTLVMSGLDLVLAAGEVAHRAAVSVAGEGYRFSRVGLAGSVVEALEGGGELVGLAAGPAREALESRGVPAPLAPVLAAIIVASAADTDPVLAIEDAAIAAGPDAGVVAGGLIGARVGLRRWPWSVPNETWFAEIGRRLVSQVGGIRDLPVPYAVEQRMKRSPRVDPREEIE